MSELLGFSATAPNKTEEEFQEILAYWNSVAEKVEWHEWKNNPLQQAGFKSYKLTVKLKPKLRTSEEVYR